MGNVHMEATQINYRGGSKKMSVEEAIKAAGTEITPEEKEWIDTIPELASQEIIAPEFDAEEGVYAVGDLVIYQGGLYKFTTAHETAGAWNPEEVAAVKVSEELSSLESGLNNIETHIDGNIVIKKNNKTVMFAVGYDNLTVDADGYVTRDGNIYTIPAAYRTVYMANTLDAYGKLRVKFDTDGTIQIPDKSSESVTIRIEAMWLTA